MIIIVSKSQVWSVDIILAVVVFMGIFFTFYAIINSDSSENARNLQQDAATIIKQVSSGQGSLKIISNNEVNVSKISELKNLSYSELKSRLRVEGDFCIYFEDENGNIVLINNSYRGVGSSNINISGTPCSQK